MFPAVNEVYYNHHFKSVDFKQMPHQIQVYVCMMLRSNKIDYYKAMQKKTKKQTKKNNENNMFYHLGLSCSKAELFKGRLALILG